MSNNKLTAVEWFAFELSKLGLLPDGVPDDIYKQAKEIDKKNHLVTFHVGVQWIQYQMDSIHGCLEYWDKEPPEFETFYNETYGGNK